MVSRPEDNKTFLPQTRRGRLSAWLLIVAVLLFLIFIGIMFFGEQQSENYLFEDLLIIPFGLAYIFAVASCVTGLAAQLGGAERSWIVSTVTTLALSASVIGIFEVIIPAVISLR